MSFLFTDIEGSTRLLAQGSEFFRALMTRHNAILRAVWNEFSGYEMQLVGDSFLIIFHSPDAAVSAAAEAQRRLAGATWPGCDRFRVRMGIHSGYARPDAEGQYVAIAVHQAARVVNVAHGGQIIVSQASRESCTPESQRALEDLGRFRVRDFSEPVALYRVTAEGWPAELSPPRLRPLERHNLVQPRTEFIGREQELKSVEAAVRPGRLFTLLGAGGMGKTRLATEFGLRHVDDWPDGAWLVPLESVHTEEAAYQMLADTVGAAAASDPVSAAADVLRSRQALIILDNCEHLPAAAANIASTLMRECPDLALLATSQQPLHVQGEKTLSLPPLATGSADAGTAASSPALALFLELAFGMRESEIAAAEALCRRLEGSPLAIELAAARATTIPPSMILQQLDVSLDILRSSAQDRPQRHRSIDEVVVWSLNLLDHEQRDTLARLSLLPGSFEFSVARAVCGDSQDGHGGMTRHIWELLERSLIQTDDSGGETRFRVPMSVREVASRELDEAQRNAALIATGQHLVERFPPSGRGDPRWVSAFGAEVHIARAVCRQLATCAQGLGLTLAWSVTALSRATCQFALGVEDAREFLRLYSLRNAERAALVGEYVRCLEETGALDEAERMMREGEALSAEYGASEHGEANWAQLRALILARAGDLAGGRAMLEKAWRESVDDRARTHIANSLAIMMSQMGDDHAARTYFLKARDLARASEQHMASLAICGNLAEFGLRSGDATSAAQHQHHALEQARLHDLPRQIAFSMIMAGRLLDMRGDLRRAVPLCHAGLSMMSSLGISLYEDDRRAVEELLGRAATALGEAGVRELRETGGSWSRHEAADEADRVLMEIAGTAGPLHAPAPAAAQPG